MNDNADAARSYLHSFALGDPEAIAGHVAPGFVNAHASALGAASEGKDEYLSRLPNFLASMPGLRYEPGVPIAEGDRVAAPYTLHANGTHADGSPVPIRVQGVMILQFEGGLIAARLDVWDALTYLRQVGQA